MLELLGAGLANLMQAQYLLPLALGTLAGIVGGALPGVTITMTIIVVLPFTFSLDPHRCSAVAERYQVEKGAAANSNTPQSAATCTPFA